MKKWSNVLAFGLAGAMIATPGLLVVPALAQGAGGPSGSSASETGTNGTMKSGAMKSSRTRGAARMSSEQVKSMQQALKDKGHDPGAIDGRMGPKTHAALSDFQKAEGLQATGRPDSETMAKLGVSGSGASSSTGTTTPSASPSTGGSSSTGTSGNGSTTGK